jgi:hypothetical protein
MPGLAPDRADRPEPMTEGTGEVEPSGGTLRASREADGDGPVCSGAHPKGR